MKPGQVAVIRHGRVVNAYLKPPAASSENLWPSSLKFELYRLPPMSTEPSTGIAAGLIVNLGGPIRVEWGNYKPNRSVVFPHGGICLGSRTESIPAFRWSEILTHAVVQISPNLFPQQNEQYRLAAAMGSTDDRILMLVRLMRAELEAGGPNGSLYGESLGHDLACHLHQCYSSVSRVTAKGGLGPRRRRMILEYVMSSAGRGAGLADMAGHLGLSVFHFSRAFRQEFGTTPYSFLLEQRVEAAKDLLLHGALKHAEIAKQLGFSTASHFAFVFRKSTGLTPNAFRKQQRSVFGLGR